MSEHEQILFIISENIRLRRQQIGLSQESLADKCGLHRTYIGAIERGERNLTIKTLARISDALGCNPVELISRNKQVISKL